VMVVSILGGLLGILMMIPLRRAFIVKMHGKPGQPNTLLYPEGTACAEVLISGEKGGASGQTVFIGFGIAFLVKMLIDGMTLLRLTVNIPLSFFSRVAVIATDMAPELLGVGYVIGARIASIMMAGAVIGNLVIVPAIATFGDQVPTAIAPGTKPISQMGLDEIQGNYLRYVGAGCVTAAGIISMARTLPLVLRTFGSSLGSLRGVGGARAIARTDRDLSGKAVLFGSVGLLVLLAIFLIQELTVAGVSDAVIKAILGAGLVLIFGFLFVTVSSRLTGEIGSSSNPISGMTVATLALTCLIFLTFHMTSPIESVVALSIGGVVCIAASNGGTTSQDLKTGHLVGATPIYQQWAILIGALSSALVIGLILIVFNQAGTVHSKRDLPQVTLSPEEYNALDRREVYDGKEYRVWWPIHVKGVPPGKYLIGEDRKPAFLVDPAITGRLNRRDDDRDVSKMKFPAPKTQVIGIIINGVLQQKLNWGLVLIGAMLSVGLELCAVGSLAFAVGVYIPMQYTTPIFLGGLVRYAVDRMTAKPAAATQDEASTIAESETGPGVLLSSGYIAGGSLAGVLFAFLGLPFPYFEAIKEAIDFSQPPVTPGGGSQPRLQLLAGHFDFASVLVFGAMMVVLFLVGSGKLFKRPSGGDQAST
jgi:uncharacterized oligopeptide transporter (OPT) family protein